MKELIAHLALFPTASGGRINAIKTGYIGDLDIGEVRVTAKVGLCGHDYLNPGESCLATLLVPAWSQFDQVLVEGREFFLTEGSKIVGLVEILRLSDKVFE